MINIEWIDLVKLIRFTIGETEQNYFKDQALILQAHNIQMKIAAEINGITEDGYVFYNPSTVTDDNITGQYEARLPRRCQFVLEASNQTEDSDQPLASIDGRPRTWTYTQGTPYNYYVVTKQGHGNYGGDYLGMFPGATTYDGTGTLASSGTTVTGTDTSFTTELTAGQYIVSDSETRQISSITSDTELITTVAFTGLSSDTFTCGARVRIRYTTLPLEYAYRVNYSGTADGCSIKSDSTNITITTTTSGVDTDNEFAYITYTTYGAMKAAMETVAGISVTSNHNPNDIIDSKIEDIESTDIFNEYGYLFDTIRLDLQFNDLLLSGVVAMCRRRDNEEGRANTELQQFYRDLKASSARYATKEEYDGGPIKNVYGGRGPYDLEWYGTITDRTS